MTNSAAITAAKLKREKKAAAIKARMDGKIAAAERREREEQEYRDMADKRKNRARTQSDECSQKRGNPCFIV